MPTSVPEEDTREIRELIYKIYETVDALDGMHLAIQYVEEFVHTFVMGVHDAI
jgi:peptide deformylase